MQTTGISRVALFIWPSLGAANKEKGKAGPDVDYTRLEHLGFTQSQHHVAPYTPLHLGDFLFELDRSGIVYSLTYPSCNCVVSVCDSLGVLFVDLQEEQAWL